MRIRFLVLIFAVLIQTACMRSVLASAETSGSKSSSNSDDVELAKECASLTHLKKTMTRLKIQVPDECGRFGAGSATQHLPAAMATARLVAPAASTHPSVGVNASIANASSTNAFGENASSANAFSVLRQDQYDQLSFVIKTQGYQVLQGASVSYSDDQISKSQSLTVKGFAGYSAYNWKSSNDRCGTNGGPAFLDGLGVGPFVQADGTFNQPTNANEKSALRFGVNTDFHLCDTLAFHQEDWNIMPYTQTDFRGRASINGFDALWEPENVTSHLGGRSDNYAPELIDGYFRIIGEANIFHVGDNGLTNFLPHTDYAFLGGTAEVRAVLFQNEPLMPQALCGTISMVGTARYLWDAVSRRPISLFGAELDYRLGGKNPYAVNCKDSPPLGSQSNSGAYAGITSFALSYNQGTDSVTFVKQNKYTASLKFSY
jgi:hypothetical protein